MRRNIVLLLSMILVTTTLRGQFVSLGCDPYKANWRRLESKNFELIYPSEIDSLAKRYLFLLESSSESVRGAVCSNIPRMPVMLHPHTVMSNGMVTWAPRRIEMITRPNIDGYSHNWEKQLILHENRHVAQISKFREGVFSPLSWALGEQAQGLGVGIYASLWSMEGDAVMSETTLSCAGRGRDPEFLMFYRRAFLEGEFRNYDRWVLGSYRDYVPNVYALGYLINSNIRMRTGDRKYYGKVLGSMISHFYSLSNTSIAYREGTGMDCEENLKNAIADYTQLWSREDSLRRKDVEDSVVSPVSKQAKYEEYRYPTPIGGDCVVALRWSLNKVSSLVMIDSTGSVSFLRYMGRLTSPLSFKNGKIYWSEVVPSKRWELQSFSDLFSYDLQSGKTTRITRCGDLYTPSHSLNGDTIAMTHYPVTGSSALVLIDSRSGEKLFSVKAPENGQIKESAWVGDVIFCTVITDAGMKIYSLDIRSKEWRPFMNFGYESISSLAEYNGRLIFESCLDGVDNIYVCDVKTAKIYRVTSVKYGAFDPSVWSDKLYFSDFYAFGKRIVKRHMDANGLVLVEKPLDLYRNPVAETLSGQESYNIDSVRIPANLDYKSEKYRRFTNLFHFHSWAPFFYNPDNITRLSKGSMMESISLGAVAFSQSLLGDAITMLGYSYNKGFHAGHLNFSYRGFYPIFELRADFNERDRCFFDAGENRVDTLRHSPYFTTQLLTYVPVNFSRGGWNRGVIPSVEWTYTNDFGGQNKLSFGLRCYSMLGMAKQNLYPRYGLGLALLYEVESNSEIKSFPVFTGNIYGYLPGFGVNHGIRYSLQYQKSFVSGAGVLLGGGITMPRGYKRNFFRDYYAVSLDYAMPFHLGDISFSGYLYLKRLQVIPFLDVAVAKDAKSKVLNMASGGCDILFDFNLFRFTLPLTAGLRYARTAENKNYIGFLFKLPL